VFVGTSSDLVDGKKKITDDIDKYTVKSEEIKVKYMIIEKFVELMRKKDEISKQTNVYINYQKE